MQPNDVESLYIKLGEMQNDAGVSFRRLVEMERQFEIMDRRTMVTATNVAEIKSTLSRIYESAKQRNGMA